MSRKNYEYKDLLETLLSKFRTCENSSQVLDILHHIARQRGFDNFASANIHTHQIDVVGEKISLWVTHYEEMGYLDIDAIAHAARHSTAPIEWIAQRPPANIHPNQRQIFNEAYDLGFRGGFCYLARKQKFNIVFGFYHQQPLTNLPAKEDIADMLLATLHAHERLRIIEQKDDDVCQEKDLSDREKVCLSLIKDGLTVSEAASVLKLADRTVTFHLQNCRAKLNAKTLPQAVAIALVHGMIEP